MLENRISGQVHCHAQYLAIEMSSVFVESLVRNVRPLAVWSTKACYAENNKNRIAVLEIAVSAVES
jgi:hypothetical protein